jgi:DNA-binding transcriptional MerR regulator
MASNGDQPLRTQEFAQLSGVTARALRHYDRLGLLKPKRTSAGYRAYSAGDVERLEQIVAFKFLGIPLKKIGLLITRTPRELARALDAQRRRQTRDSTDESSRRLKCKVMASVEQEIRANRAGESRPVEIIISRGPR